MSILFILNPKSGRTSRVNVPDLLARYLDPARLSYEVVDTQYAGHATELARQAAAQGFAVVGAVGGDGTVNEVARGLLGTNAALAILPKGSGNGLARHLRIPLNLPQAIRIINQQFISRIDTGAINGHPFFCTAGIGFDAYISAGFAGSTRRGLRTYTELVLREFRQFKPRPIWLTLNEQRLPTDCFVVAFANASQYGNNVHIAPQADIRDGLLDVCLVRELNVRQALRLVWGMLTKQIIAGSGAEYFTATTIEVSSEHALKFHTDGEYAGEAQQFAISLAPLSLAVVTPRAV